MNKKLISLLVVICLVIGLLPVASIADGSETKIAKIAIMKNSADHTLEVTEGGEPIYGKSVAFDGYDKAGTAVVGTGWKFTTDGASATDYNFKFEYPLGGIPTLTLNNAKLNQLNSSGNPLYVPKADGSGYESTGSWSLASPRKTQTSDIAIDLKIVLQGTNEIYTYNGIVRGGASASNKFNSVTIVGETGSSLIGNGKAIGIQGKNGVPITIQNANITLTTSSASPNATTVTAAAAIYTEDANITIVDSTLNLTSTTSTTSAINAICANGSGSITVTNSNLELTATSTAFNKAPTLSAGATIVAGDDATSAAAADAAALTTAKYAKVTYPAAQPTTTPTAAPTTPPTTAPTTPPTTAPTAPVAGGDLATKPSIRIGYSNYQLKKYDTPIYLVNYSEEVKDTAGNSFTAWYNTTTNANEENYTLKYEWKTGDANPTLTLRGYKYVGRNIETGKLLGKVVSGDYTSTGVEAYPLTLPSNVATDIILTGEDSLIAGAFGVTYKNDTTITSVGTTKLVMHSRTGCFASNKTEGASLTINANLDLSTASYYNMAFSAGVIQTYKADLTINGGTITCNNTADKSVAGLVADEGGNIVINGGTIYAKGAQGRSNTSGAIHANNGKIIITGGTVTAAAREALGFYSSQGIEISGGTVNMVDHIHFGMNSAGDILITGGIVEISTASTTSAGAFYKAPVLGAGISGICGTKTDYYLYTDGTTDYSKKYVKLGAGVGDNAPTKPTSGSATTAPTTTPGTSSTSGTAAPTAPTGPAPTYGDALSTQPSIRLGFSNQKLTNYDKPIYMVSVSSETEDTDGNKFTQWTPTNTGANEENYNLKFVWNSGDANPKLILRGFKYDEWNNKDERMASKTSNGEYTGSAMQTYPLSMPSNVPIDIIITGEDSLIECQFGIVFKNNTTIKSEGTSKLVINSRTACLTSADVTGAKLTIDANLDFTTGTYYNTTYSAGVIQTNQADLVVNGGKISCMNKADKSVAGMIARTSGNVIINGGDIAMHGVQGTSTITGTLFAPGGKVIITGGKVDVSAMATLAVYALNGVEIKGGTTRINAGSYYGINVGDETVDSKIEITGGTVEIVSLNGGFYEKPELGAGVTGYAGDSVKYAKAYTETDFKAKYIKIGLNVTAPDPSNLPTAPGMDPSAPGINPGAPEVEPTVNPNAKPGDKLQKNYSVEVGGVKLTIKNYDTAVYTVNTKKEVIDNAGNTFTATVQTATDASENNWNTKYVWHANEAIPTLYINGMVIDEYNEATEKWMARYQADPTKTEIAYTTGIKIPAGQYMKVVITGADSTFQCRFGIIYKSKLLLKSEGEAKLTIHNFSGAVTSDGASGIPLVVNANLDLSVSNYYNTNNSHVLQTCGADLIINGGNIKIDSSAPASIVAIFTQGSGNIIINGGNLTVDSPVGTSPEQGSIKSIEKIIINGGTINATAKTSMPMYAKRGIEINRGVVNLTSSYYGINAGNSKEPADIVFNGGTTTITAQYACYKAPLIGPNVFAYAGAGPKSAMVFDGSEPNLAKKPWFFVTDDEDKKIVIEEDDFEDEEIPFDPTETPSDPNAPEATDPTVNSGATDATTPDATIPEDEIPEDEFEDEVEDEVDYYVTPNLEIYGGISDDISDGLLEVGIDSPDMIQNILVENVWAIDEYAEYFAFFDITLMYFDGEDWVKADEEHFPEDGVVVALLPYPVGTDINTEFTAVHMFSSDAFGMTPGDVELLLPVNVEEGILVELTGLSPVALGWYDEGGNPPTGDLNVAMYMTMMVVSLVGLATTVVLEKKRKAR